jgi:hypothetical protein
MEAFADKELYTTILPAGGTLNVPANAVLVSILEVFNVIY